ncbi:MAG TPA: glycosyltransferase family 4 protein [Acidimicrobiales bacterium]|nr:glycosyltransferase family 4 protein [Acidimicrobiales bacterium]
MPGPLRIAFTVYRGNPHSGGQGVYTRYLTRELAAMGHTVEVFSGQPYPVLDEGVTLTKVPSLDLYRQPDPFRIPHPREFRSLIDVLEFAIMCTAGFPEPRTWSRRIRRVLRARRDDFDVVHDNQCLGNGMLGVVADGWPVLTTLHHPITVDRDLELSHAHSPWRRFTLRRWYGFLAMQTRVAQKLPRLLTVSHSSKRDIVAQMGVDADKLAVVAVGVDTDRFRPLAHVAKISGRLMTTASADVPLKGLVPLLEALAKVRTERHADLVVVGQPRPESRVDETIERLGLREAVTFVSGVSDDRIVELYNEAEVAVVPSLYEGFSLPAIEAMACGTALVATTGGALPEVVGEDGVAGRLVAPNDPGALAVAISEVLADDALRAGLGERGRKRVMDKFTWRACAEGTVAEYRRLLETAEPQC